MNGAPNVQIATPQDSEEAPAYKVDKKGRIIIKNAKKRIQNAKQAIGERIWSTMLDEGTEDVTLKKETILELKKRRKQEIMRKELEPYLAVDPLQGKVNSRIFDLLPESYL